MEIKEKKIESITPGMNRRLPFPKADPELWDRVHRQGFAAYPERYENFQKYKMSKRGVVVDHLPVRLDIENVSRCNFHCQMCQVSDWPGFKRTRDMTLEEFKALLNEQYGLTEIKLQGMGEPLIAGQTFFDMVEHARKRHLWVRSITNGSILHVKENYKKVIDADVCELHVSIDGTTAEVFEKIRRGGKFPKVTANAKLLNTYAQAQGRDRTRMWTVVQADNFHQLEAFPVLAAELGFTRCTLSLDLNDWGQEEWKDNNNQRDKHHDLSIERARAIIEIGEKLGVEVTYWYMDSKYELGTTPDKLCPWPFSRGYISSEMKLVPCCMVANPDVANLGDATHLTETWNGKKMQGFRKAHLTGKLPKICQDCYYKGQH